MGPKRRRGKGNISKVQGIVMARKRRRAKGGKEDISKEEKEEADDVPVSDELSILNITSVKEENITEEKELNDTKISQDKDGPSRSLVTGSEEFATPAPGLRRTSRRLKKSPVLADYHYTGFSEVNSTPVKIEKCGQNNQAKVIIEKLEDSPSKSEQLKKDVDSMDCDTKQDSDVGLSNEEDALVPTSIKPLDDTMSKGEEEIDKTLNSKECSSLSTAASIGGSCISSSEHENAKKLKVTSPTANMPASTDKNISILKEIITLNSTDIHESPSNTAHLKVADTMDIDKSPLKEESKSDTKDSDLPKPSEKVNLPDSREEENGFKIMEESPISPVLDLLHIEDELIYEEFQLENSQTDSIEDLTEFDNTNIEKKEGLNKVDGALDNISDDELIDFDGATSDGIGEISQAVSTNIVSSQKRNLKVMSGVIINKGKNPDKSKSEINKTSESSLPGQSYIICSVAPKAREITLTNKMIVFDCVACQFSNKDHLCSIWEHGNSKGHILKVMEIEYPKLYDLYKEDKAVSSLTLKNLIFSSKEKQNKHLVIPIKGEFASAKRIIQKEISALLQNNCVKGGFKHSAEASTEVKEESRPSTTDKVPILHEEEERLKLEVLGVELAQKQKTRSYQRILIVMDQNDVVISSNTFGKYVKVLRRANLSFDNALQTLKDDEWFGKGTLHVFLCGIYSLIFSKPHMSCKKSGCPNPVEINILEKRLPTTFLISKALKLQEDILDATESDLVLFCDLFPVNIDKSNCATLDKRPCMDVHTIDVHRRVPAYITNLYLDCIREYNKFVDAHSQSSGFEFWELTKSTFSVTTDDLKTVIERLEKDGVSLSEKLYVRRVSTITYNVCKLLRKIGNKEEKDYVDEVTSQPSKMTMNEEDVQKLIGISLDEAVPRQYDKAVILVDHINEAAVNKYFVGTKISAVHFYNMDIEVVKSTIKSKALEMPAKTLWIFLVGSSLVTQSRRCTTCSGSCSSGLQSLTPKKYINSAQDVSMVVTNTYNSIRKLHDQLKSIINPESDFIVIPAIPLAIYVDKEFGHDILHSIQETNFSFVTAAENNITLLQHLLTEFSRESINICVEMLQEIRCPINSINGYERSLSNSHVQIMRKMENPSDVYFNLWKMAISKLFYHLLSRKIDIKLESVDKTSENPDNCTENLLVPEAMEFSDDDSPMNDEEKIENNFEFKSETTIPVPADKFESIVFVSVGGQRNPFQISGSNIYVCKLELPVKDKDLLAEFSYLMEPNKKTLFVLIGDISLAVNQKISSTCEEFECPKPIYCICLDKFNSVVDERINMLKQIKEKLKNQFLGDECKVVIGPIWPRFVVKKSITQNPSVHDSEHKAGSHSSFPCFLDAEEEKTLDEAISVFKSKWNEELNLDLNTFNPETKDLFAKYLKKNIPLIEFKTLKQSSLDAFSMIQVQYRSFWRSFIDSVLILKESEDMNGVIQRIIGRSTSQQDLNIPNQKSFPPILSPHQTVSPSETPVVAPYQTSMHPMSITPCPTPSYPPPSPFMDNSSNFPMNYPPPPYQQQFANSGNVNYGTGYDQSQFNNYQQPQQFQNNYPYSTTTPSSYGVPPIISAQQNTSNVKQSTRTNLLNVTLSNSSQNPPMPSPLVSQPVSESKFPVVSFLNYLSNLPTSISTSAQSYDKVIFIGKQRIFKSLPKMGFKNVGFVNHSLDHISKLNVESVMKQIGPITNRCFCVLAFGLSAFARPSRSNCDKFKCIKRIPAFSFGTPNLSGEKMARAFISHRMSEIEEFITTMSSYMPTVALPLFPCKVFCDDDSDMMRHQSTHAITLAESYVVFGSEKEWATYFSLIIFAWNNFIKRTHAAYTAPELIQKYIDSQKKTFEIKKEVREFTAGANLTIWGSFTLTLMRIILGVSKIELRTHPTSSQSTIPVLGSSTGFKEMASMNNIPSLSSTAESNYVAVQVWNVSETVPQQMLYRFFNTVDPQASIQMQSDSYIIQLPKDRALLIVGKLNECNIGDRIVKASIVGEENKRVLLNPEQKKYVSELYDTILKEWKPTLINNLVQKYGKESEVAKYKMELCLGYCWGVIDNCSYYHTDFDRRRNPAVFLYSPNLCDLPKFNQNKCVNGDMCPNSHNYFEQMFHPVNLHTVVCSNPVRSECPKQPYCPYAHKYSPEMLFVSSWEDLLLYGSENTFEFFTGVLRQYAKITSKTNLKLCLISTCGATLAAVDQIISQRFPHLRNVAVSLRGNHKVDPALYQIFYGLLCADFSLKKFFFHQNAFGVLIVDGISDIMAHPQARKQFSKFWEKEKAWNRGWASINKVFVSKKYYLGTANAVSNYVGVRLHEVTGIEVSGSKNIGPPTSASLPVGPSTSSVGESWSKSSCPPTRARSPPSLMDVVGVVENPQKPRSVSPMSPKSRESRSPSSKRWWLQSKPRRSSSISRRMSRSPSRRRVSRSPLRRRPAPSPSRSRWSRSPSRRRRSRSISRRRRSKSRSIIRWRRSRSISPRRRSTSRPKRRRSRSRSRQRSRSRPRSPPAKVSMTEFLGSKQPRLLESNITNQRPPQPRMGLSEAIAGDRSKMISGKSEQSGPSISSRLREILDEDCKGFLQAEKELRVAHDDEYEVFQTFPELHPEYERHYEEFSKIYQNKYGLGLDVNHKEKMFSEYWNSKFSMIKFEHWVKRRSELEGEYKAKTTMSNAPNRNDWGPSTSGLKKPFTVKGTLDILESLLNEIGVLGPALSPIIRSARDFGVDTPKALSFFCDSENLIILNMTMDKLKSLKKTASANIFPTLSLAVDWGYRLVEHAKNAANKPNLDNLNLEAIAKASLGKDSAFILNVIETAIAYEGIADVPKEEINNIFLKVCSIHFNMQMNTASR